jgi:hypothetical protein
MKNGSGDNCVVYHLEVEVVGEISKYGFVSQLT